MYFNQEVQKIGKLKQEIRTELCSLKLLNMEHKIGGKIYPNTGHEGPEGRRGIALRLL